MTQRHLDLLLGFVLGVIAVKLVDYWLWIAIVAIFGVAIVYAHRTGALERLISRLKG